MWVIKHHDRIVFESNVCLLNIPDDRAYHMIKLYNHYTKNFLPFEGGLLDQPNYFLSAMNVIQGAASG